MIQNLNKKCLNYGFSLRRSWSKNAFISHTPQADFETFARKATQKATPEQANRKVHVLYSIYKSLGHQVLQKIHPVISLRLWRPNFLLCWCLTFQQVFSYFSHSAPFNLLEQKEKSSWATFFSYFCPYRPAPFHLLIPQWNWELVSVIYNARTRK